MHVPIHTILIHTKDGTHAEDVEIIETHDREHKNSRFSSGCLFRSLTGKVFFLKFHRFSFHIKAA